MKLREGAPSRSPTSTHSGPCGPPFVQYTPCGDTSTNAPNHCWQFWMLAAVVPFGGFELLREERPDAAFKGEDMQGSTTMLVDFSLMSTSPLWVTGACHSFLDNAT